MRSSWSPTTGASRSASRSPTAIPSGCERLVLCNAPPLVDGFEWPRLARIVAHVPDRRGADGLDDAGDARAGAPARVASRGCVARLTGAEVWDQFDQGTQRAILRLVRSAGKIAWW